MEFNGIQEPYGYWTLSTYGGADKYYVWIVLCDRYVDNDSSDYFAEVGVRPVITLKI